MSCFQNEAEIVVRFPEVPSGACAEQCLHNISIETQLSLDDAPQKRTNKYPLWVREYPCKLVSDLQRVACHKS